MAIKGLVDTQAYVVGDYQAPVGYYTPARSIGDYVLDDYVITDYLLEGLDLQSTFTIQAEGEINAIRATLISVFTLQAEAEDLDLATGTLSGAFTISVTPTRIVSASGSYTAQAQQSANANVLVDVTKSITARAIHGTSANYAVASSGTIDITGFYTQTQVAGELFFGEPLDVTWDSFRESEFIDRTWDEWFGDQWDQGGVLFSQAIVLEALGGYRAQASATLQSEFSQQQDITIIISQGITANTTQQAQGNFTASADSDVTASATVSGDGERFRGVAIDGTPLDVPAVFEQAANANAVFDPSPEITANATQEANANVIFDPSNTLTTAFTHTTQANARFSITEELEAFNTQISFGRKILLADPWNILHVPPQTRTLVIPEDSRVLEVLEETRLNTTSAETRNIKVTQETRNYKIFKPVFTDLGTLPRTRSEV